MWTIKKSSLKHPLRTFGSFTFFRASLWLGVNKVLQKLTKSYKGELRHLFQCCILIPWKCPRKTPFQHTVPKEHLCKPDPCVLKTKIASKVYTKKAGAAHAWYFFFFSLHVLCKGAVAWLRRDMVKAILYDSWYPGTPEGDSRGEGQIPPPQFWVDQLNISPPGEHINTCSPGFSYLPTPLYLSPLGYWTGVNWLSCKRALFRLLATHTSYSTTVSRKPLMGIGYWVLSSGLLKKGARFS